MSDRTPKVHMATRADEPEIMRLLHIMHAECGMRPLNEEAARDTFDMAFNKKGGIIGVIRAQNEIRAIIFLLITRFWYTFDYHLEELFNYVRPDSRHSNYARALISFAKHNSDRLRIPLVIGVLTNSRMEEKVRLYRRALGVPAGAFFVVNANWANVQPSNEDFWKSPFPKRGDKLRAVPMSTGTTAMVGMMQS